MAPAASLQLGFGWMRYAPFNRLEVRQEFVRRLGLPPDAGITEEVIADGKFPSVPFATFASDEAFAKLTDAIL